MKLTAIIALIFGLSYVCGNMVNYLATTPAFSALYSAMDNCANCQSFTDSGGLLVTREGNFFAVANTGAAAIGTITANRLSEWLLNNDTLNAAVLPIPLSSLTNDQILPTQSARKIRFNVYPNGGTPFTAANGVRIHEEIIVVAAFQTIWRTNDNFVVVLQEIPAWPLIQGDATLNSLENALTKANPALVNRLGDTTLSTTIFAPTETAFNKLAAVLYNRLDLFTNEVKPPVKSRLSRILNYHLVNTCYWRVGLADGDYNTLNGNTIAVSGSSITDAQGRVSQITSFDINPVNGVLHKIDDVLLPEPLPTFATTTTDWNSWGSSNYNNFNTVANGNGFNAAIMSNTSATGYTFIGPTAFPANENFYKYLIQGVFFSNQLSNDLVLPTVGGTTLRFNMYESWYVNGRPLVLDYMDWVTVNGAFHVYTNQGFFIPFFTATVWDRIPSDHPFKASLVAEGLQTLLSSPGAFTVLLPLDTLWNSNDSALIRYHIVTSTIFKQHTAIYPTLQGATVNCTVVGFNGVSVQGYDIVNRGATNGMVILLGGVLPNPPVVVTTGVVGQVTTESLQTTGVLSTTVQQVTTGSNVPVGSASALSFSVAVCFFALFASLFM